MPRGKGLLQEKFQVTAEPRAKRDHAWTSFESQRDTRAQEEQHYAVPSSEKRMAIGGALADFDAPRTNRMPPGMNINNQTQTPNMPQPRSAAGETDVSDMVSSSMRNGFTRIPMMGTDDLYTNEHTEEFYGEANGEDDAGNKYTGFLERNNYLDRT